MLRKANLFIACIKLNYPVLQSDFINFVIIATKCTRNYYLFNQNSGV